MNFKNLKVNDNSQLAPVALFVFNRPGHTKKTLEALSENQLAKDTDVYIYSDNYKEEKDKSSVEKVRKFINNYPKSKWYEYSYYLVTNDKNVKDVKFLQKISNFLKINEKKE